MPNSTDVQLAMRDCYETTYGIYDHRRDRETDALSLVALREVEDSALGGLLYERIRLYMERDVKKYFGESLTDFLALPTDIVNYCFELCKKRQEQDSRTQDGVLNELQQMAGGS